MTKEIKNLRENFSIRRKAEKQMIKKETVKKTLGRETANIKLVHELEVHQIELEVQYEELVLAEAKAEMATKKFTELYEFAPVGYFILDSNCTICELNLSAANTLGKGRSVLVNKTFRLFVTNETLHVFNDFFRDVFLTRSKQTCEVGLIQYGEKAIFIHVDGIISEDTGKCLLTTIDITDRKQADEKLQNSETRYRRLFESAKDGILILDANDGKIIDVNPFLIEMLGYTYEEFLGKELWEIGIFKNIDDSKAAFVELQNKGYIRFDDMPLVSKNGRPIDVEYVSSVYYVDKAKVIQCNLRNMTDRKRAEEALVESEKRLLELNNTKDKFFSIIAHDLKSPFNSIIGLSDLLSEKVHRKDYNEIEEYACIIKDSSWRAMDLLKNLIEWSQLQTGRMEFNRKQIDIIPLIIEAKDLLKDSALQKSIIISLEVPESFMIIADKPMISTVLRNLLSNAIKFTKQGGKIILSSEKRENELFVKVTDNGVGIKKEIINKIFLIEGGISTPGTQDEQGTGLGLILCKDFILKHGGKIWVESEVGCGSKFIFTLPV